jgi:hypothetical protein
LCGELVVVGREDNVKKGCRRVNVVEKLYTHYENGNEMLKLFQE